jgi:predicted membrane-bound spermidine synthase
MSVTSRVHRLLGTRVPVPRPFAARVPSASPREILIGALFGLSGTPALIYQVAWQRILAFHSGVGPSSIAAIVAAYMAGLGLGSLAGGALSRRLSSRLALIVYAILELAIGTFALFSVSIYYDLLSLTGPWLYDTPRRLAGVHFVALLPPTFLMGMTLPLLVRGILRGGLIASRTIGRLYGMNVIGAALGAALCPWVLVPALGIGGAIAVGAACNAVVGLGMLVTSLAFDTTAEVDERSFPLADDTPVRGTTPRGPFAAWIVLSMLSGAIAIALEIVWFRLIDVAVKATSFTFGTVLALYLLGFGLGSYLGASWAGRARDPLGAFLSCQCLLLVYVGLELLLLIHLPPDMWGLRSLYEYWGSYEPLAPVTDNVGPLLVLYAGLPVLFFGVPTVLMGTSFALVQAAIQDRHQTSGVKLGTVQFANIVGCTAGCLLVGLVLFRSLGTAGTSRAIVASGLLFAALGAVRSRGRRAFLALGAILLALVVLLPSQDGLWGRLHGQDGGRSLFDEDETGVVAFTSEPDGRWRLSVNGKGQSFLPYGGIHSELGALAATLHPAPRHVAIVGLGSGDTAWAAACRSETEQVDVFEICPAQFRLLRGLRDLSRLPGLDAFLTDDRVRVIAADGRHALASGGRSYDLIEADAIRPNGAFSGNLYSVEFFRECSRNLNPGGLMCTWSPTPRTAATFLNAFPYVLMTDGGQVLIGSNQPIEMDRGAWEGRLSTPGVKGHLGLDVHAQCLSSVCGARLVWHDELPSEATNADLFPRDEYQVPQAATPLPWSPFLAR